MYRYAKLTAVLLTAVCVIAGMTTACASTSFSSVQDKDWELIEVRTQPENLIFDRNKLKNEGFENIFTIRFDTERISGVGAPNNFFAPYTLKDKQGITIKTIAQTLMAPIREPEKLKERDFFTYLQNADKWGFEKANMTLHSKGEDGSGAVLVFRPGGKK